MQVLSLQRAYGGEVNSPEQVAAYLAAGMNDHIVKPINIEEMFATLARWVRPDQGETGR